MKLDDLKKIFNQTYNEYNNYMEKNICDYWNHYHFITRRLQIESVINTLNENFNFDKLNVLETGVSFNSEGGLFGCLLYTSDAADDLLCVDLGGRRIIKKKKNIHEYTDRVLVKNI